MLLNKLEIIKKKLGENLFYSRDSITGSTSLNCTKPVCPVLKIKKKSGENWTINQKSQIITNKENHLLVELIVDLKILWRILIWKNHIKKNKLAVCYM